MIQGSLRTESEEVATAGRRQASLAQAIFFASLIVVIASFPVASLGIDGAVVIVAVVAALTGGLLVRLRSLWRWLVLLILPTVIVWGAVFAAIALVMLLSPCGGWLCD